MSAVDTPTPINVKTTTGRRGFYMSVYGALKYYIKPKAQIGKKGNASAPAEPDNQALKLYNLMKGEEAKDVRQDEFTIELQNQASNLLRTGQWEPTTKAKGGKGIYDMLLSTRGSDSDFDSIVKTEDDTYYLPESITRDLFITRFAPTSGIRNDDKVKKVELYKFILDEIQKSPQIYGIEISLVQALFEVKTKGAIKMYKMADKDEKILDKLQSEKPVYVVIYVDSSISPVYFYWTLTDSNNIKVGNPQPVELSESNIAELKEKNLNIEISYKSGAYFDTIDYFKLGINRHAQVEKYMKERDARQAEINKVIEHDNMRADVVSKTKNLHAVMSFSNLNTAVIQAAENRRLDNEIMLNRKSLSTLIIDTQKQLSEFIASGFKQVQHQLRETTKVIVLTIQESLQQQSHDMRKIDINRENMQVNMLYDLTENIRVNSRVILSSLHELEVKSVELGGSFKTNITRTQNKILLASKAQEGVTLNIKINATKVATEFVRVNTRLDDLTARLKAEIERAEKREKELQDAIEAEAKRAELAEKKELERAEKAEAKLSAELVAETALARAEEEKLRKALEVEQTRAAKEEDKLKAELGTAVANIAQTKGELNALSAKYNTEIPPTIAEVRALGGRVAAAEANASRALSTAEATNHAALAAIASRPAPNPFQPAPNPFQPAPNPFQPAPQGLFQQALTSAPTPLLAAMDAAMRNDPMGRT